MHGAACCAPFLIPRAIVCTSYAAAKGGAKSTINFNDRQMRCHDAWKMFAEARGRMSELQSRKDSVGMQARLIVDELPQKN